ncbi:flagellar basal body P-ring protein FlgI [Paracoccus litorisediminis]|uniref:flagellar basal body P-ring protein FlgI n=1 Tax=Paracoccus litorisediminis TaxID=2006130 RepID=UPI0037339A0A
MIRTAFLAFCMSLSAGQVYGDVRIKDVVTFEGVRENQLVGYGLVVGLNGTGDNLKNSPMTRKSLEGMLGRLGVGNLTEESLKTNNTAAVMVTANLPPFARRGAPIDIVISSIGDAKSLRGGTLVISPLTGADGNIYAVGQGPISVGGYAVQGRAASVVEGVPTVARIENGAIVEKEIGFDLASLGSFRMALREPDATTASRIAAAVNSSGLGNARMLDPGTVEVKPSSKTSLVESMASIEQIGIEPDAVAKVVIDSKSGTIVIGSNVRIGEVAVSQGGLTVSVTEKPIVSQPEPITIGETVVVPATEIKVEKKNSGFALLEGPVSLKDLVDGLNAIGIGAQETISILQAIKAAGALHADLEII